MAPPCPYCTAFAREGCDYCLGVKRVPARRAEDGSITLDAATCPATSGCGCADRPTRCARCVEAAIEFARGWDTYGRKIPPADKESAAPHAAGEPTPRDPRSSCACPPLAAAHRKPGRRCDACPLNSRSPGNHDRADVPRYAWSGVMPPELAAVLDALGWSPLPDGADPRDAHVAVLIAEDHTRQPAPEELPRAGELVRNSAGVTLGAALPPARTVGELASQRARAALTSPDALLARMPEVRRALLVPMSPADGQRLASLNPKAASLGHAGALSGPPHSLHDYDSADGFWLAVAAAAALKIDPAVRRRPDPSPALLRAVRPAALTDRGEFNGQWPRGWVVAASDAPDAFAAAWRALALCGVLPAPSLADAEVVILCTSPRLFGVADEDKIKRVLLPRQHHAERGPGVAALPAPAYADLLRAADSARVKVVEYRTASGGRKADTLAGCKPQRGDVVLSPDPAATIAARITTTPDPTTAPSPYEVLPYDCPAALRELATRLRMQAQATPPHSETYDRDEAVKRIKKLAADPRRLVVVAPDEYLPPVEAVRQSPLAPLAALPLAPVLYPQHEPSARELAAFVVAEAARRTAPVDRDRLAQTLAAMPPITDPPHRIGPLADETPRSQSRSLAAAEAALRGQPVYITAAPVPKWDDPPAPSPRPEKPPAGRVSVPVVRSPGLHVEAGDVSTPPPECPGKPYLGDHAIGMPVLIRAGGGYLDGVLLGRHGDPMAWRWLVRVGGMTLIAKDTGTTGNRSIGAPARYVLSDE